MAAFVAACGGRGEGESTAPPLGSGKLDPAFGDSGRVLLTGTDSGLAVSPNGAAYVGGDAVIRIDPAGNARTFFGPVGASRFYSPALDEAGNLLVLYSPDRRVSHVAKIDASGQLVASFGTNGVGILPFDPTKTSPFRIALDGEGNVYALGNVLANDVASMVIARLDASGRQVASFGTNGITTFGPGSRSTRGQAIATDRDGNILVAGSLDGAPVVVKFDPSGKPASTFGTGGVWTTSGCGGGGAFAIALDAASNIFVAAICNGSALFKLDPLGRTVESFRDRGLRGDLLGPASAPWAIAVRSNGEIYVGGYASAPSCTDFVVAKVDSRGEAVASFGSAGVAKFDIEEDLITELAFDGEGRLYAAGGVGICGGPRSQQRGFVVYRLGP